MTELPMMSVKRAYVKWETYNGTTTEYHKTGVMDLVDAERFAYMLTEQVVVRNEEVVQVNAFEDLPSDLVVHVYDEVMEGFFTSKVSELELPVCGHNNSKWRIATQDEINAYFEG